MIRIDIDEVWQEFEPLAAATMADEDDGPEDIRTACRNDKAWIFGADDCFLVLQYQLRPGTMSMQLLIWLFVSRGPHGCIERYSDWLQVMAARHGASRILFRTRRQGFRRSLPQLWKLDHMVWSMEVSSVKG